jgi:hypothetical protein
MKKELVIAILIGLVVGFGLAAVFWTRTQASSLNLSFLSGRNKQSQENNSPTSAPEPTQEENQEVPLNITSPNNEIVHPSEGLTISGNTSPNATVVVVWEEGEDILVADDSGEFETEVTLVGGENRIDISAYADNGTKNSQTLTVTYSTADF